MQRITEPELMDDKAQALAYANADFTKTDNHFVQHIVSHIDPGKCCHAVDLGCGPGNISFPLAAALPDTQVIGIDGANAMLALARQRLETTQNLSNLTFRQQRLPLDPEHNRQYDLIISNSLLHHLHNPDILWHTIRQCAAPDARVFIMDLYRPDSKVAAREIVHQYARDAPEILQDDFYNSLLAAFSLEEIQQQLAAGKLDDFSVSTLDDRHVLIENSEGIS